MDKLEITTGRLNRDVAEGGVTLIQISLQYPIIAGDGTGNPALNHCFSQTAENLVTTLSQEMLGEARAAASILPEALPYQLSGTFTTTYNVPGVFSFFTDIFLYAGGMRGITYRYSNSFFTTDGKRPLFLTTLFPVSSDPAMLISEFIAQRQGLDRASIQAAFSPENVYLTENGLAVFFHPGAMEPVAGGIPVFVIPYSESGPFPPSILAGNKKFAFVSP